MRRIDMQDASPVVGQDNEDEEDSAGERWHQKKSMATVEPRWFARTVRHVCDGGIRRRGISREIHSMAFESASSRRVADCEAI